ncbi:hypothetical protein CAI21_16065 [Alkalilimnicola ehrlichii]|uniref:Phosphatidic acid phosphatase type 2/haloperoxidase domain-containing protein n=2 Tax=Alkalilimnicola ehrlichii TaxID=351052 RepID=A0A3E0WLQ9_9GAMM|nr:hypothetical protein CAI21_16065 [Alkalilimnicola ehrlichii]RFA33892.1 hypothetical protein CAL65_16185 [Alkalilimnicola ehrlichii]
MPTYLANYWRVPAHMATDVVEGQWLTEPGTLVALSSVGIAFLLDESIRDYWQDNIRSDATEDVSNLLFEAARFDVAIPALLAGYGLATVTGEHYHADSLALVAQSAVISQVGTNAVKRLAGRHRPETSPEDSSRWGAGEKAFFSGHASGAWAVATVMSYRYSETPFAAPVSYGLATAVSLARIDSDDHWTSDTIAGALFGYWVGKTVAEHSPFPQRNAYVLPMMDGDSTGIRLHIAF